MSDTKRMIHRSEDRVIAGVIGGFAAYFGLEPTILRLTAVFLVVATGILPGVITYIVAIFIMPRASSTVPDKAPAEVQQATQ